MAETYESKINSEHVQGWTRRTVADGDYLQSKTIQPLVNRDSILAKGLDDTNTLINGMSDKVDDVETKCDAQEVLVKSLSGDVEDFCASATEAFEQIKTNEQTLAGNVEGVQQSVKTLSGDIWNMNFMGFKDSTTVFVKEEIKQGKHMFSFSSVGGGGGGTSYDMAWYPSVDAAGNISWEWNQTTTAPTTANIKGPQGATGPTGPDGKTPVLSANSYNLYWKYSDATSGWTDLGDFRGEQGVTPHIDPTNKHWYIGETDTGIVAEGKDGTDGKDGTNGTNGTNGADACPISAKSTEITNGHNVKIFYTSAANPDTNPLADFNVMDGEDSHGSSDVFDNTTMSGNGSQQTPYGVNTNVLATHTWVENQHYIANVTTDTTTISGTGLTDSPLGITKTKKDNWDSAYEVSEAYKVASGKFVTSAAADFPNAGQYGIIKDNNGIHWGEIQGGGGTVYDIVGNNGISAKKDTANNQYIVGLSGSYLPTSGGTVSGKLTVSGSDFDNSLEIIRGGSDTSASTGQIGINGAGGLSFKIKRGNNNTQLNIAPNATMDKRFSIGDNPYSPAAYLIPAVTANTTAGLTNDGILHIILES